MFIAFVLNENSQASLISRSKPQHDIVHAHHVTLVFNPDESEVIHWSKFIGKQGWIETGNRHIDQRGEAFEVEPWVSFGNPRGGKLTEPIEKEFPHITFSVDADTPAKYSNELIARDGRQSTIVREHPMTLYGTIQFL